MSLLLTGSFQSTKQENSVNCTQIHHSVEIRSEMQAEKPVRRPPQVQAREDEANCAPHSGRLLVAGNKSQANAWLWSLEGSLGSCQVGKSTHKKEETGNIDKKGKNQLHKLLEWKGGKGIKRIRKRN